MGSGILGRALDTVSSERMFATTNRFVGTDDDGRPVGYVSLTVTEGGANRWWFAWRNNGTADGITVGQFCTAEEAMVATDEAG
jgi:hypothetical protein